MSSVHRQLRVPGQPQAARQGLLRVGQVPRRPPRETPPDTGVVAVAPPAPLSLASRAPRWLLIAFIISMLLALNWGAFFALGLINTQYGNYPVENITLNAVIALAAVAMLGLQRRRHSSVCTCGAIGAGRWRPSPRASGFSQ